MAVIARLRNKNYLTIFGNSQRLYRAMIRYCESKNKNNTPKVPKQFKTYFSQQLLPHCDKLISYIAYANNFSANDNKQLRLKYHDLIIAEIDIIDITFSAIIAEIKQVTQQQIEEGVGDNSILKIGNLLNEIYISAINWKRSIIKQ